MTIVNRYKIFWFLTLMAVGLCPSVFGAGPFYLRSGDGNDGDSGLSVEDAWLTWQHAADTVVAGETLLPCDDGPYVLSATVNWNTNSGDGDDPITVRAVQADGTDDGTTRVILIGAGIGAAPIFDITTSYHVFEGLMFRQATADTITISGTGQEVFINCRVFDGASDGIYVSNSGTNVYLYDCEIDNNTDTGMRGSTTTSRGHFYLKNCSVHHNGSHGVFGAMRVGSGASGSLFTDNGGDGIHADGTTDGTVDHMRIEGCTIANNGGSGIDVVAGQSFSVVDCVISSNTAYSINTNTGKLGQIEYMARICSYPNGGTDHIDINGGTLPGSGHVLDTDPNFVGASDFAVQLASIIQVAALLPANGPNNVVTFGAVVDAIESSGDASASTVTARYIVTPRSGITVTETDAAIVQKGGTAGTSAMFYDICQADEGGSYTLLYNAACTVDMSLTNEIRVAGWESTACSFTLIGTSAGGGDTLDIQGLDACGNEQTESIDVSGGDGDYVGSNVWKKISKLDCTGWADGVVAVTQARWGLVSPTLGPELVTNGDFTFWTADDPDGMTVGLEDGANSVTENSGKARFVGDGSAALYVGVISWTAGNVYRVQTEVTDATSSSLKFWDQSGGGIFGPSAGLDSVGTYVQYYRPTGTAFRIFRFAGVPYDVTIDNISVRKVTGQYYANANLEVGDGSNSTYFKTTGEQIMQAGWVSVKANAQLNIGEDSGNADESGLGSAWQWNGDGDNNDLVQAGGTLLGYGSMIRSITSQYNNVKGGGICSIYDSILSGEDSGVGNFSGVWIWRNGSTGALGNVYAHDVTYISVRDIDVTVSRLTVDTTDKGARTLSADSVMTGLLVRNAATADIATITGDTTLVNPRYHPSSPQVETAGKWIRESYTVNVHVQDRQGDPLEGTTVTMATSASVQVFSVLTDGNGDIAEQTVTAKQWTGTEEFLLDYSPFTFTVSKDGYGDLLIEKITLNKPQVLRFKLGVDEFPFPGFRQ